MTYADAFNLRATSLNFNNVADAIDGTISRRWGGTSAGTSTAYTVTCSPAWTAYENGSLLAFVPHATNTGATTINVNGLGVKTIRYKNRALVGGEIVINNEAVLVYDGTVFNLVNHGGGWPSWTPTITGVTNALTSSTVNTAVFKNEGDMVFVDLDVSITTGVAAPTAINWSAPVAGGTGAPFIYSSANNEVGFTVNSGTANVLRYFHRLLATLPASTTFTLRAVGFYRMT